MNRKFGAYVRRQRKMLLQLDEKFGLRRVAVRIGVEPSYLSKIERGAVPPPSDATIMRLARGVGLDSDELLGLAGRIAPDVRAIILKRPKLTGDLVRQFAEVSDEAVLRVILRARRTGKQ